MVYLYLLLIFFLNSNALQTKFCVNCKYFTNDFIPMNDEFGKCLFYPVIVENKEDFLVTGIKSQEIIENRYCSIVRGNENMCGKEGKNYVEKEKRKFYFLNRKKPSI